MSKLRDNQALCDEARELILAEWHRTFRLGRIDSTMLATDILDAVDRHLPCCGKGAKLAEDWVARYKCPTHGWRDNPGVVAAHPDHLQGEAPSCTCAGPNPNGCGCVVCGCTYSRAPATTKETNDGK